MHFFTVLSVFLYFSHANKHRKRYFNKPAASHGNTECRVFVNIQYGVLLKNSHLRTNTYRLFPYKVDSFRAVREDGSSEIVDRSVLRAVQTPQVFGAKLLREAYAKCSGGAGFTDDASVVEGAGASVTLVEGERTNIKITTHEDITLAESFLNLLQ